MTDANGTRNIRSGGSNLGSAGAHTPQTNLGSPLSGGTPVSSSPGNPSPSGNPSSSNSTPFNRPSFDSSQSRRPRQRFDQEKSAGEKSPNRRTRRTSQSDPSRRRSSGKAAERQRLFGTGTDRIKSKSSSRTRALKAKDRSASGPTGRAQMRVLKKKADSPALGKAAKATLAEKARPLLPNSSQPGRVPPSRTLARRKRRSTKMPAALRGTLQLLIVGFGIAAIGGTLLQVLPKPPAPSAAEAEPAETPPTPISKPFPVALNQEIPALKSELQELPNLYPNLTPKVFYVDVDTGQYVNVEGGEAIAAASTIKLPILLAFFEEVDAGRIDPNQTMAIQQTQIAEGSGDMQLSPPGTQFTALEVATQMIVNSDNTATNMMIDLLGGKDVLNSWFKLQGLEKTVLNNPLPDLEGTNMTSARDLSHTMLLISEGDDLSVRSRDRMLNILNRTYNKSLIPDGLIQQGALTFNKTGDIASVLGDVALVDMANGKRYVVAALVERPENDGRARELIRRISGRTYQEADRALQPAVTPLGDPDAPAAEGAPSPAQAQPVEEPYPSANPRTAPRSVTPGNPAAGDSAE
ncbi:MAG: serine hydrolase [Cyanobacteria bacterium J06554_11]